MKLWARPLLMTGLGIALFSAAAVAEKRPLAMLDQLAAGEWELREHGEGSQPGKLCLRGGRDLIQLRHPGAPCSIVVVDDRPNEVTVQYTCAGRGYGRTHIRRETNGLVQVDGQGIVGGQPFAFAAEGRRIGACGG